MRDLYLAATHDSYLSLSDIMVTEEKVCCTLNADFDGLGYIHPSSGSESGSLTSGTTLDLPFWMAFHLNKRNWAKLQLPQAFQKDARDMLVAGSRVVDLGRDGVGRSWRFSENYYALGIYMVPYAEAEAKDVRASLASTFQTRFRNVMNWSSSSQRDTLGKLVKSFDRSEAQLLKVGKADQALYTQWDERRGKTLKASPLLKEIRPVRTQRFSTDGQARKRARV